MAETGAGHFDRRFRRAAGTVFAAAGILVLAVTALVAWDLYGERRGIVSAAKREALTLARSLSAHTEYTLRAAEVALDRIAAEVPSAEGERRPEAVRRAMLDVSRILPAIDNIVQANAAGIVVNSTAGLPPTRLDVSDRENFIAHRESPSLEMMATEPIVGRITGDTILPLSRRLSNADGSFAGVIVATIGPGHFEALFAEVEARPRSALLLAHVNGQVMSRFPPTEAVGATFADGPLFKTHLAAAPVGTYLSPPLSDGEVRIVGYKIVNGSDLVVAAALNRKEVLAVWWENFYSRLGFLAVFTLLVAATAAVLYGQVKRQHALLLGRDRQAEDLERSETRFRDFAELTADWFWETDMQQRFTFLTGATAYTGAGLHVEDWLGRDRWDKHRDYTDLSLPEEIQGYMDRGEPFFDIRRRFEHPEVGESWFSISGKPIRDESGSLVGYRGVGRNATAEEKAAKAIRDQRELLRLIVESVPASVYLKDLEGRYLLLNDRHRRFLGLGDKEVEGRSLADLVAAGHGDGGLGKNWAAEYERQDREVREAVASRTFEVSLELEGRPHRFQVTKFPVFDGDGNFVAIGGINVDVTERLALETQLQQAQKLEAIGQLTGGIAHDFNNLLAVILGNAEMLSDWPDSAVDVPEVGRIISLAADRGAELTSRLLAFSRQQGLDPRAFDVNDRISKFQQLLSRTLGEMVTVETHFMDGLWPAYADPSQLENAILNLAINARDAMPQGGTLTIETRNFEVEGAAGEDEEFEAGRYVCIAVTDSGEGMRPEVVDRAFEPFFTTKEVGKGSGLGLSMVYGFLKQSGGVARIYSEEGVGTTVRLYLPSAGPAPAAAPGDGDTGSTPAEGGHEVLLVVEDNDLVRASVVDHLSGLGYVVHAAADGFEAQRILDSGVGIDLLFTDLIMPGSLHGYEIAATALDQRPGLKVILTTGFSGTTRFQIPAVLTDAPILRKPYRRRDLAVLLRRILDGNAG